LNIAQNNYLVIENKKSSSKIPKNYEGKKVDLAAGLVRKSKESVVDRVNEIGCLAD